MLNALRDAAQEELPSLVKQDERDMFYNSWTWRTKRIEIVTRDNRECQVCKSEGRVTLTNLIAHHIKPLEFYPELKLEDDNLVTVCHACHNSIHYSNDTRWDDEWW